MQTIFLFIMIILSSLTLPTLALSQDGAKGKSADRAKERDEIDEASTSFNFDAATLEGKMKAPDGMMLKGRVQQNKSQMVQLRQNWRSDLKKSPASVRAIKARE